MANMGRPMGGMHGNNPGTYLPRRPEHTMQPGMPMRQPGAPGMGVPLMAQVYSQNHLSEAVDLQTCVNFGASTARHAHEAAPNSWPGLAPCITSTRFGLPRL